MSAVTTQIQPRYRVHAKRYGFNFSSGQNRSAEKYSIKVAGMGLEISEAKYVRIDKGGRSRFFGTQHNGAYFFTVEAYKEGLVSGDELFAHIDRGYHPDNVPLSFARDTSFANWDRTQQLDTESGRMFKKGYVSEANYVSALAKVFPQMRFEFIHSDDALVGPVDWEGMSFRRMVSIFERPRLGENDIASIDLDIFASITEKKDHQELMRRIVWLTQPCKLIMFFTSPGYIDHEIANNAAQALADRLLAE